MAELALICPVCKGAVNVPIEADASEFVCGHCGETSPIQMSLDAFTENLKDPLIGQVVSDCEIIEKVGEGGFGAVYRAFDRNLQRDVALKVMLQSLTSNLEFVQKFIREAVTAAQLNHPNIVAIHKVGRDEERNVHFLIMEYLEGRTLSDIIEERGCLPLDEAISAVVQCADALSVAQDKNIIHRDIKPENIMIDRHGTVKITDFGLAKTVTTTMKSTKVVGTPHYMSPEQFEGKAVDARTDIYSLGITFYYMLTKAKPYEGTNTVQIIYSILTQEPKPVTELNHDVPEEIWAIIRKMIAKDVEDRYADCREIRQDLLAFQERSLTQKVACPKCQAQNVRGRKFCRECGTSLVLVCPHCGREEVAGTRHCGQCGAHIEGLLQVTQNLERGRKLRQFGDLKRALAFYDEVLKLEPEHQEAVKERAEVKAELDRIEDRKKRIDELVKAGDADGALEQVRELLSEFEKIDEVKTYGQTVKRSLTFRAVDAHLLVAEKALGEGRLEDAIDAYRSALAADPERDDIRSKLDGLQKKIAAFEETLKAAEAAFAEGRHADAMREAKEVLVLKPGHARAEEILAESKEKVESIEGLVAEAREHLENKDFDEAITQLGIAHEVSPGDPSVNELLDTAKRKKAALEGSLALARRFLAEDRPDESLKTLTELLEEYPKHETALALKRDAESGLEKKRREEELSGLLDRARSAERKGDLEGAVAAYRELLGKDPEHEMAVAGLEKVESRIEETDQLRRLVDEHLEEGAFARAVAALNRLREMLPGDPELEEKAAFAAKKMEEVEAVLRRAQTAVKRKQFDQAIAAAEELLVLSPGHGQAESVKKEAERGKAAIAKHLEEAEGLVESELFDDALAELEKAVEKGASEEDVAPLRSKADEGKMLLLKSDATRSYGFEDYSGAIEKYEAVLELEEEDSDAQKGLKVARRALLARSRESYIGKGLAAAVAFACLLVVQSMALGPLGGEGRKEVAVIHDVPEPGPEDTQPRKLAYEDILAMEEKIGSADLEGWKSALEDYREQQSYYEDDPALEEAVAFAEALIPVLESGERAPAGHITRLDECRQLAMTGGFRPLWQLRKEKVNELMAEEAERWLAVARTEEESGDLKAALETYDRIAGHPALADQEAARTATGLADVVRAVVDAKQDVELGRYAGAWTSLRIARNRGPSDPDHEELLKNEKERVLDGWKDQLRTRLKELDAGAGDERKAQEIFDALVRIAVDEEMDENAREELYRSVNQR